MEELYNEIYSLLRNYGFKNNLYLVGSGYNIAFIRIDTASDSFVFIFNVSSDDEICDSIISLLNEYNITYEIYDRRITIKIPVPEFKRVANTLFSRIKDILDEYINRVSKEKELKKKVELSKFRSQIEQV